MVGNYFIILPGKETILFCRVTGMLFVKWIATNPDKSGQRRGTKDTKSRSYGEQHGCPISSSTAIPAIHYTAPPLCLL